MDFITSLIIVLAVALVGRFLSLKLKQPVILGEIFLGAVIGNIGLYVYEGGLVFDPIINNISDLGVLFLLLSAGLSLNLSEFKKMEINSSIVAIFGVVLPFILPDGLDGFFGGWFNISK